MFGMAADNLRSEDLLSGTANMLPAPMRGAFFMPLKSLAAWRTKDLGKIVNDDLIVTKGKEHAKTFLQFVRVLRSTVRWA